MAQLLYMYSDMPKKTKSLCVENVVEEMKNKFPECGKKQLKEQSRSETQSMT